MAYVKYTSIENHYQDKYINGLLLNIVGIEDMLFQITEKFDGSNFQIEITKNSVRYGKRSTWLAEDESFYDWQTIVRQTKVMKFIEAAQSYLKNKTDQINIYGEIFGPAIQKRIQYGANKDIRFFEMKINGLWKSPKFMEEFMTELNSFELHTPILGIVKGLEAALEFNTEISTKLFEKYDKGNYDEAQEMEGVVIKPYEEALDYRNSHVIIKKKNKKFAEKMGATIKERKETKYTDLQVEFLTYINENRMCSLISKEGEPESPKDIGKYIGLLSQDCFNDFAKDQGWDIFTMDKKDKKPYISLVGSFGAPLIKAYL